MAKQNSFVIVSDSVYLRYAKPLMNSIELNCPDNDVNLLLINCSDEDVSSLKADYPQIKIQIEHRTFQNDDQKRSYCANRRARFLLDLLESDYKKLLYVDADSIIRADLEELWSLLDTCDVSILLREDSADERMMCATGVIGIANSPSAKHLLTTWANYLESDTDRWFNDQVYFYKTYLELKNSVKVCSLPPQFIDWEFQSNTPIWVGKGPRKSDDRIYVLEERLYEKKGGRKATIIHRIKVLLARTSKRVQQLRRNGFGLVRRSNG